MEAMPMHDLFFDEEDVEFEICHGGESPETDRFDWLVGKLEEAVMATEFAQLLQTFRQKHQAVFTPESENALVYTEIFHEYLATIESYVEQALSDSELRELHALMPTRHAEVDEALLETLLSFTDFEVFKELMLAGQDNPGLVVDGASSVIHLDEMEDGEPRPDLEGITGVRVS